eukprot:GSA120T00025383001.1
MIAATNSANGIAGGAIGGAMGASTSPANMSGFVKKQPNAYLSAVLSSTATEEQNNNKPTAFS